MANLQAIFSFDFRSQWSIEYLQPLRAVCCRLWPLTWWTLFPNIYSEFPLLQLMFVASNTFNVHLQEESGCLFSTLSYWVIENRSLSSSLFHTDKIRFLSLSLYILCSSPQNTLVVWHWLIPLCQCFLSTGEPKTGHDTLVATSLVPNSEESLWPAGYTLPHIAPHAVILHLCKGTLLNNVCLVHWDT